MFFELARPNVQIRIGGGSEFLLKCLRILLVFLIKISFLPYRGTDLIKILKWPPHDTEQIDPVLDHFGAATLAIPENFRFQT